MRLGGHTFRLLHFLPPILAGRRPQESRDQFETKAENADNHTNSPVEVRSGVFLPTQLPLLGLR